MEKSFSGGWLAHLRAARTWYTGAQRILPFTLHVVETTANEPRDGQFPQPYLQALLPTASPAALEVYAAGVRADCVNFMS